MNRAAIRCLNEWLRLPGKPRIDLLPLLQNAKRVTEFYVSRTHYRVRHYWTTKE